MKNFLEKNSLLKSGETLILYELNEVPWKVIDWYIEQRPYSAFSRLMKSAKTFTTVTKDEGELHPWTTWPTLHRGVYNTSHNIRFINQDLACASAYPPIWETLKEAGKKVGVFGSLQSYPPIKDGYAFYIPDTFSPGCETFPKEYSAFQRFNLRQTQRDGAQASNLQLDTSVVNDVLNMMKVGLGINSCKTIVLHVLKEKFNSLNRSRRSVIQGVVAFDIFKHILNKTKPDFCTFFTNHVAGMMHRYWKQTFPEDFDFTLNSAADKFHANNIKFAMDIADAQLDFMMKYIDSVNGILILASSMGQEAIDRGEYIGEWRINDTEKFLSTIGWKKAVKNMLAMQPDFNFCFESNDDAESFLKLTANLTDLQGRSIWKRSQRTGTSINLGLAPSKLAIETGEVIFSCPGHVVQKLKISDMGMQNLNRDPGTGYHQPYGVLLLYGKSISHEDSRLEIESIDVRSLILNLMGGS